MQRKKLAKAIGCNPTHLLPSKVVRSPLNLFLSEFWAISRRKGESSEATASRLLARFFMKGRSFLAHYTNVSRSANERDGARKLLARKLNAIQAEFGMHPYSPRIINELCRLGRTEPKTNAEGIFRISVRVFHSLSPTRKALFTEIARNHLARKFTKKSPITGKSIYIAMHTNTLSRESQRTKLREKLKKNYELLRPEVKARFEAEAKVIRVRVVEYRPNAALENAFRKAFIPVFYQCLSHGSVETFGELIKAFRKVCEAKKII